MKDNLKYVSIIHEAIIILIIGAIEAIYSHSNTELHYNVMPDLVISLYQYNLTELIRIICWETALYAHI